MSVQLNHTIVHARDAQASAAFLTEILGLPPASRFYHFHVVETANGVSLDFLDNREEIMPQHYAFLISEAEFDQIFARIQARGLKFWADPYKSRPGAINHGDGGRGLYFEDPDKHLLEILTKPYGSGA